MHKDDIYRILDTKFDKKSNENARRFLIQQGLAMDPNHACHVAYQWTQQPGTDPFESKSHFQGATDALRKSLAAHFCGMTQTPQKVCVLSGDVISFVACGEWVMHRAPMKLHSKELTLCIDHETNVNEAELFTLKKLNQAKGPIEYGEQIHMIASQGKPYQVVFSCPGKTGEVCVGDHVYLTVMNSSNLTKYTFGLSSKTRKRGTPLLLNKLGHSDMLHSSVCLTITTRGVGKSCPVPVATTTKNDLSVLVYNAWMMPHLAGTCTLIQNLGFKFSVGKNDRAYLIPNALERAIEERMNSIVPDVIVLCEAFCDIARTILKAGLKRQFGTVFETPVGGHGNILRIRALCSGGVTVLSRYPIVHTSLRVFEESAGSDGLANKCAIYVRIIKNGRPVNMIATHLQAWNTPAAIKAREAQMATVRNMMDEMKIPSTEPFIIAGDLNVCRIRYPTQYVRMLQHLDSDDPHEIDEESMEVGRLLVQIQDKKKKQGYLEGSHAISPDVRRAVETDPRMRDIFSSNTCINRLASGGPHSEDCCELLDYVLVSRNHTRVKDSMTAILSNVASETEYKWKKESFTDLSDHFPCMAYLQFDDDQKSSKTL